MNKRLKKELFILIVFIKLILCNVGYFIESIFSKIAEKYNNMHEISILHVFTDGSVNTKQNFGYGAFLAITDYETSVSNPEQFVKVKRFEQTSSTKLELQTLLWALSEILDFKGRIALYTDSQNILGLAGRRERLEKSDFYSKQNRRITNWELYQAFYRLTDELNIEIKKVRGHKRTSTKDNIDRLFTIVDRASRNALRDSQH